jgi:hypothetical protein
MGREIEHLGFFTGFEIVFALFGKQFSEGDFGPKGNELQREKCLS